MKHTENAALNASYMSPRIQNELLTIWGNNSEIVKNVNNAGVFAILIDDIAGQEQMSVSDMQLNLIIFL